MTSGRSQAMTPSQATQTLKPRTSPHSKTQFALEACYRQMWAMWMEYSCGIPGSPLEGLLFLIRSQRKVWEGFFGICLQGGGRAPASGPGQYLWEYPLHVLRDWLNLRVCKCNYEHTHMESDMKSVQAFPCLSLTTKYNFTHRGHRTALCYLTEQSISWDYLGSMHIFQFPKAQITEMHMVSIMDHVPPRFCCLSHKQDFSAGLWYSITKDLLMWHLFPLIYYIFPRGIL